MQILISNQWAGFKINLQHSVIDLLEYDQVTFYFTTFNNLLNYFEDQKH